MEKTVEYYLGLPYTIEMIPEPEGGWFVAVKELPGCMSEGDTPEEAMEMIRDAMRGWIEVSLEDGDAIPEPRDLDDYSGKFVVRVPRSLHRDLVELARQEGVSLNQYINVALGQAVAGARSPGVGLRSRDDERLLDLWLRAERHPGAARLREALVHYLAEDGETDLPGAQTKP